MSRATVRAAVTAFVSTPLVEGFTQVLRSAPKLVPGQAFSFNLPPSTPSGAVGIVHIQDDSEQALTLGPNMINRQVSYKIGILMAFYSIQPQAEDAMDDYDDMVEALKARLRSDPTLGTAGSANPIFMAGRGRPTGSGGQPDLSITSDLPKLSAGGGGVHIWGVLELSVTEQIVA